MPSRPEIFEEPEHPPALSSTRTAWAALMLLALVIAAWLFFNPLACTLLKSGLTVASWLHGEQLHIGKLSLGEDGSFQAEVVEWSYGPKEHRSSWKSEWLIIRPTPFWKMVRPGKHQQRAVIRELLAGKTKLLMDRRGTTSVTPGKSPEVAVAADAAPQLLHFLPASCTGGPVDVVAIGENYRAAVSGVYLHLPEQWAGKISFAEAALDIGFWHRSIPRGGTIALLEGSTLRLGALNLGNELGLKELTLALTREGLEFGVRGTVGKGLLRGDGVIGAGENARNLEVTLVGERLALDAFAPLMSRVKASGTISQARFTFRGDTERPLEAASSLRLIAQDFQWEGRGWESLRLAATLTGRNLTVTECNLQQHENELTAEGQSRLPEDWRAALRAPFTARFTAQLADAGALGALIGRDFSQLGGGLSLDGEIKGADNKADGYCNVTANGLRIRELPVDWMNACLLFEGETTRLGNLDAWSGNDHLVIQGTVSNRRPHVYKATASVDVQNLTKRLWQIGVTTAESMGAGAVKGTWQGEGSSESHAGLFQASVSEWVSPWTRGGMSGSFEGSYSKGRLDLSKAELRQGDLKLGFKLATTDKKLEATDIVAVSGEKTKPLLEGSIAIPLNAADFWQSGSLGRTLAMTEPLAVNLALHSIKAEELSDLLGQPRQFAGTLDGTLAATGTSEKPIIHGSLQISKFVTGGRSASRELALSFDSDKGRAMAVLVEQPVASSPWQIRAEIPFVFTQDKGKILMADGTGPINISATLHQAPLDGWLSLTGLNGWPLRQVTADGTVALSGTFDKPSLEGSLIVKAGEAELFGSHKLQQLVVPISLKGNTAGCTNGSASYQGKPVGVTGSVDWSGKELSVEMHLAGKDLPLKIGEIGEIGVLGEIAENNVGTRMESVGNATLTLTAKGTNKPTLAGTITVTSLSGSPLPRMTPCFAPPGIQLHPAHPSGSTNRAGAPNLLLDLQVKTESALSIRPTPGNQAATTTPTSSANVTTELPQLAMDLRLKGAASSPRLTGTLTATKWGAALPAGRFTIPEATVRLGEGEEASTLAATAYGITRHGLSSLSITGALAEPEVSFTGPLDVSAPDLLLSLSVPTGYGISSTAPAERIARNRQAELFSFPSVAWMTARIGKQAAGSLGFYGAPWIWSIDLGACNMPRPTTAPKQESK